MEGRRRINFYYVKLSPREGLFFLHFVDRLYLDGSFLNKARNPRFFLIIRIIIFFLSFWSWFKNETKLTSFKNPNNLIRITRSWDYLSWLFFYSEIIPLRQSRQLLRRMNEAHIQFCFFYYYYLFWLDKIIVIGIRYL